MKKYLIICAIAIIMMVPIAGATTTVNITNNEQINTSAKEDFTHTVLIEYATLTTCGPCVTASTQLYNIYNDGDLDFYYVTLVGDVGLLRINKRIQELGVYAVPDVYFDGGYRRILGAQSTEQYYRNAITQSGERVVPDIDVSVEVNWQGSGTLKIDVTVVNNEPEEYNGHLRTYILEKDSRWNNHAGSPYHYAVLDIPIDKSLSIRSSRIQPRGDTYTFSKTWLGSLYGFGDITQDNIVVVASIFDKDTGYAVQTAAGEPSKSSNTPRFFNTFFYQLFERLINIFPLIK